MLRELQEQWSSLLPPCQVKGEEEGVPPICQVEGEKEGVVTKMVLGDPGELDEEGKPHGEVGILSTIVIFCNHQNN